MYKAPRFCVRVRSTSNFAAVATAAAAVAAAAGNQMSVQQRGSSRVSTMPSSSSSSASAAMAATPAQRQPWFGVRTLEHYEKIEQVGEGTYGYASLKATPSINHSLQCLTIHSLTPPAPPHDIQMGFQGAVTRHRRAGSSQENQSAQPRRRGMCVYSTIHSPPRLCSPTT